MQANIWYTIRIDLSKSLYIEEIIPEFQIYTVNTFENSDKLVKIDENKAVG